MEKILNPKNITKQQYDQLLKYKEQADILQAQLDEIVKEAEAITKEQTEGGHTFDYILNNFCDLDGLLDTLEIEVI